MNHRTYVFCEPCFDISESDLRGGLLSINNRNLRCLIININYFNDSRTIVGAEHLPFILASVKSQSLKEVIFIPPMDSARYISTVVWSEMATLFERPQFQQLSRIVFGLSVGPSNDLNLEVDIQERLSECCARGVLVLTKVKYGAIHGWWHGCR